MMDQRGFGIVDIHLSVSRDAAKVSCGELILFHYASYGRAIISAIVPDVMSMPRQAGIWFIATITAAG